MICGINLKSFLPRKGYDLLKVFIGKLIWRGLPDINERHRKIPPDWHVQIIKDGNKYVLLQKANIERIDVSDYLI